MLRVHVITYLIIYTLTHACTHVHTHTHTHVQTHTYTHTHAQAHTIVCTFHKHSTREGRLNLLLQVNTNLTHAHLQ